MYSSCENQSSMSFIRFVAMTAYTLTIASVPLFSSRSCFVMASVIEYPLQSKAAVFQRSFLEKVRVSPSTYPSSVFRLYSTFQSIIVPDQPKLMRPLDLRSAIILRLRRMLDSTSLIYFRVVVLTTLDQLAPAMETPESVVHVCYPNSVF